MLKKLLILSLSFLTVNYTLYAAEPNYPLHEAAENGDIVKVKELLQHCDVNEKNKFGWTPLHCAAMFDHHEVAQALLADSRCTTTAVNEKDNTGFTPLHWAAQFGRHEVVQVLLADSRCTTTAVNEKHPAAGCTPLHYAAYRGHHTVVQVLLADGRCLVNEKDNDGRTPLDLARNQGLGNIEYLITHWNAFVKGLHISWYKSILAGNHPRCGAHSPVSQAFPCNALREVLAYLRQGNCIYSHEDIVRCVAIAQLQQQEQQLPQQQQKQQQGTGWCTIS